MGTVKRYDQKRASKEETDRVRRLSSVRPGRVVGLPGLAQTRCMVANLGNPHSRLHLLFVRKPGVWSYPESGFVKLRILPARSAVGERVRERLYRETEFHSERLVNELDHLVTTKTPSAPCENRCCLFALSRRGKTGSSEEDGNVPNRESRLS
jgi:hypothetical protein